MRFPIALCIIFWLTQLPPFGGIEGGCQDIHFSQYTESPSTLNPASTGVINGEFRVIGNFKDQWRSIANPYTTFSGSYDMPFYREIITDGSLGFGVSFISDKAGDLQFGTNQINFSLAANKSVNRENNFSLGLQGGFTQRGIDYTKQEDRKSVV